MTTDLRAFKGKPGEPDYRFHFFSELLGRPICAGKITDKIGRLDDLIFILAEPYPEAVGIFMDHGWGRPNEIIPWKNVLRIEEDAIFVAPPEGAQFPPFVDQPRWMLVQKHLMGRTIFDMDGRRVEAVNDVHFLESQGRVLLVHVDISLNGFLRRWHLGGLNLMKDQFISWKHVQPLNTEDAVVTDKFSLSVTRHQLKELPAEDLADALEELSGEEQRALFHALDAETAAETLVEAEPRAQRQLVASLRRERAAAILSEMSVPQLADLFSVLPHDQMTAMMAMLPADLVPRIRKILSEREATAAALMSSDFISVAPEAKVQDVLEEMRHSKREHHAVSYVYVTVGNGSILGVVDLRDLVLAPDDATLSSIMTSPVITAEETSPREDLEAIFRKYHYRMLPVVDPSERIVGVIRYNDIMKGPELKGKA
jgi:CBS domain-containing protein/uncharacterized protein YrrD